MSTATPDLGRPRVVQVMTPATTGGVAPPLIDLARPNPLRTPSCRYLRGEGMTQQPLRGGLRS